MIQVEGLVKRYGARVAVDHLDFVVEPGRVTGFLGPNGSGKSTTMRCMLDLDRPNAGRTTFGGRAYRELARPLHEVGALLDAGYVHPTRKARLHLLALAASNGLPRSRVDEVLAMVGLSEVAEVRPKAYSLGMKQRLGLAAAMLGDPKVLILDEPANGLDPEGIRWIRDFLSVLARQGRSVFVSSHLLAEMALMADHLIVIGRGRMVEEGSVADFVSRYADHWVRVKTPEPVRLSGLLASAGAVVSTATEALEVRGASAAEVGELAARSGVVLHELSPLTGSLEDAYLRLTSGEQEYRAVAPTAAAHPIAPPSPLGAAGPGPQHVPAPPPPGAIAPKPLPPPVAPPSQGEWP